MIDFDYSETAGWFGIAFALIGAAIAVVFYLIAGLGTGLRIGFKKLERGWYPQIFHIVPIAMVIGAAIAIPPFWTVHVFRSLELNSVSGLRIRPVDLPDSPFVLYSDAI